MNYRHAFHAGNFADCFKHALLVWLVRALQRKPGGFTMLDTHAGPGSHDLHAGPAARTGEYLNGIAKLREQPPEPLADYVRLVEEIGLYPGSPLIARRLLRPQDRLVCCELHPDEFASLDRAFRGDSQVAAHERDGWEALGALLPPAPRRGLVLIDPPYEAPGEYARVVEGLCTGHRRFATGVFAAWYPIKHLAPVHALRAALAGSSLRDVLMAELLLREPYDAARLNGCGLVLVNPPFRFEAEAPAILDALLDRLGDRAAGAAATLTRLTDA